MMVFLMIYFKAGEEERLLLRLTGWRECRE
jgi:hypothetical protein